MGFRDTTDAAGLGRHGREASLRPKTLSIFLQFYFFFFDRQALIRVSFAILGGKGERRDEQDNEKKKGFLHTGPLHV